MLKIMFWELFAWRFVPNLFKGRFFFVLAKWLTRFVTFVAHFEWWIKDNSKIINKTNNYTYTYITHSNNTEQ